MVKKPVFYSENTKISPFWRGHLFLFDTPRSVNYSPQQGNRLLWVFILMEFFIRPLILFVSRRVGISHHHWWLACNIAILVFLSYFLVRILAGIKVSRLGLYPWGNWSKIEKLYFAQIIPITIFIFSIINFTSLRALSGRPDLFEIVFLTLIPQVIWGAYQEFLYRGILQTELVRRWGAFRGILASNLVFTFGSLHAYHFLIAEKNPAHLWIFVAIFGIGLFFSVLFRRSGNLWLIGILHGLGDMFIDGLSGLS